MTKKAEQKPREYKTLPVYVVNTDDAAGIVEAVVNVFGIIDLGDDIIHNGAYTKTLNERGNQIKIRVLDSHNTDSILRVIGKPLEVREIGRDELARIAPKVLEKHPEATGGLYTKTQFLMNTPEGDGAYKRLASGAVDEWSIALDPLQVDYTKEMKDGKEITVRNIYQIRLYEYSPVIWGMNQATVTTDVKTVTTYQDLPLAARDAAWDSGAADERVREWVGGADNMDWAKYGKAFFWHDGENPELFTSYKLGYADVIDGDLQAVPRAIFAVAGVLQGARGGVDIPEAEQTTVKAQVESYYTKMSDAYGEDLTPPWSKQRDNPADAKDRTIGTRLETNMRYAATFCILDWFEDGSIDGTTMSLLNSVVESSMITLREGLPASVADTRLEPEWWSGANGVGKAGRMISGANRDKIQQAMDVLQALLDASAPEDVQLGAQVTPEAKSGAKPALTGSLTGDNPDPASIIDQADLDREQASLALLMEMVT